MNPNKYIILATLLLSTPGLLLTGGRNSRERKPRKAMGEVATQNVKESVQEFDKSVDKFEKMVDKLDNMFTGKRAEEVVNGAVIGLFTGVAGAAKMGATATVEAGSTALTTVAAGTKATALAVVASPLTVPVAVGAAGVGSVGFLGYVFMLENREHEFRRCLTRNFDCEKSGLNDRGFPRRCNSPARRYAYWYKRGEDSIARRYVAMKKKGLRPEGELLGHYGVEDEKIDQ